MRQLVRSVFVILAILIGMLVVPLAPTRVAQAHGDKHSSVPIDLAHTDSPLLLGYAPDGSLAFISTGREITADNVAKIWHGGTLTRNTVVGECYAPTKHELFSVAAMGLREYQVLSLRWGRAYNVTVTRLDRLSDADKPLFDQTYSRVLLWLGEREWCRALDVTIGRLARVVGFTYHVGPSRG